MSDRKHYRRKTNKNNISNSRKKSISLLINIHRNRNIYRNNRYNINFRNRKIKEIGRIIR